MTKDQKYDLIAGGCIMTGMIIGLILIWYMINIGVK